MTLESDGFTMITTISVEVQAENYKTIEDNKKQATAMAGVVAAKMKEKKQREEEEEAKVNQFFNIEQ